MVSRKTQLNTMTETTSLKSRTQVQGIQLSDEPTLIIGNDPEYQHTYQETTPTPSALLPLIREMDSYLGTLTPKTPEEDIQRTLNGIADKIVIQLQENNANELKYSYTIIDTIKHILSHKLFNLQTLVPDTIALVAAIKDILIQYNALLDYIPLYVESYNYTPSNDDPKHIKYYNDYTDKAVTGYVYKLLDATGSIDKVEGLLARKGLYKLLLTADVTLIEPNTQIVNFVGVIQAVQNNRLYRGRELMIIALNEVIATSNLIRLMWLLIQLNYQALQVENKDNRDLYEELKKLIEEFEKTRDPDLLDKILDLIKKIEDALKDKTNESTEISKITSDLNKIGKLQDKSSIQRYIDTLDGFIAKINAINNRLSTFDYTIDYSALQQVLDKLSILQDLLDKLLGDFKLAPYFNKANEIIQAINRTVEAIQAVNCLLKQAMCLVASTINFTNSILAPAIKNIQGTVKGLGEDIESTIDRFAKDTLEPFNDAIKRVVYEQARSILKGRGYELATAINKTDDQFTTSYNSIIDAVIDSALGNSTSAMEYLKNTSSKMMGDIAESFHIDERKATNCPPLTIKGNLSIPNLSLNSNTPSLNNISLDVKC